MEDAQNLAKRAAAAMWADDHASQSLGMELTHIAPGEATLTMPVTKAMTNGHGTAHGGIIFTLADSAFAFACNSRNQRTVAQHCSITYLAPAHEGDTLRAEAREIALTGRSGIYDIRVFRGQTCIAEFRGHSRTIKGQHVPEGGD